MGNAASLLHPHGHQRYGAFGHTVHHPDPAYGIPAGYAGQGQYGYSPRYNYSGHGYPGHGYPGHGYPGQGYPGHGYPGHGYPGYSYQGHHGQEYGSRYGYTGVQTYSGQSWKSWLGLCAACLLCLLCSGCSSPVSRSNGGDYGGDYGDEDHGPSDYGGTISVSPPPTGFQAMDDL